MKRISSTFAFVFGLAFGMLIGGSIVSAAHGKATKTMLEEMEQMGRTNRTLWALAEAQSAVLGKCDQIMLRLGLEP
jgi:hypothetical protein